MNTYRSSMCYKVGEALEAKRKEFQEKRKYIPIYCIDYILSTSGAKQQSQPTPSQSNSSVKKHQLSTGSQYITIPNAMASTMTSTKPFKMPSKSAKPVKANQRPILPKIPDMNKLQKTKTETVTLSTQSVYPKLTTPDLHQKRVIDASIESDMIAREGSLLKPPILTTRPTILKPFMISSNESKLLILLIESPTNCKLHWTAAPKSTSVTGPVINYPDISKIKSICKTSNPQSLIAPRASNNTNSASRSKLSYNSSSSISGLPPFT